MIKKSTGVQLLSMDSLKVEFDEEVDEIKQSNIGFYEVTKGQYKGLLSNDLEIRIPCKYDYIRPISDEYFAVGFKKEWAYLDHSLSMGVVNAKGEVIIPLEYGLYTNSYRDEMKFTKGTKHYYFNEYTKLMEPDE